jgi:hypothetical protein
MMNDLTGCQDLNAMNENVNERHGTPVMADDEVKWGRLRHG